METARQIGRFALGLFAFLSAYQAVFTVAGFFVKPKTYPEPSKKRRFGIVIAARNEESVIGHLLDSIARQDYDPALLTVYVVADNCTDRTAAVCREKGAVVYERHDPARARKGYALEFLFERIAEDVGIESADAYLFFDADNLLKRDFVTQINRALGEDGDIVTGYRNTKNFDTNFISAAYGIHFYRNTVIRHRPRGFFGQSTHIAGTGYAVSARLLKNGWHWTCLTEDTQFCLDQIANGARIDYCEAAEFFDEQPHTLRVMFRQRIRWAKGRLACFFRMFPKLVRGLFTCKTRKFSCYDMIFYSAPKAGIAAAASLLFGAVTRIVRLLSDPAGVLAGVPAALRDALPGAARAIALAWIRSVALGALVVFRERKKIHRGGWKTALYVFLWPVFDLTNLPIFIVSLFLRVKWKPIRHDRDVAIDELEADGGS